MGRSSSAKASEDKGWGDWERGRWGDWEMLQAGRRYAARKIWMWVKKVIEVSAVGTICL